MEKRLTPDLTCRHCRNVGPMEILHRYSQVRERSDPRSFLEWEEGYVYELLLCPACSGASLRRYYWHDFREPEEIAEEVLFPTDPRVPPGLPEAIENEYLAALQVRRIDPNAYGVLLGRLLELVCENRGARGDSLYEKLRDLANRNEIPKRLADLANSLRLFRNVAAHANAGELTQADVPVLDRHVEHLLSMSMAPRISCDKQRNSSLCSRGFVGASQESHSK